MTAIASATRWKNGWTKGAIAIYLYRRLAKRCGAIRLWNPGLTGMCGTGLIVTVASWLIAASIANEPS
jgi:hypothetical protein